MACRRLPYYHRFLYKENFSSPLKVVYRKPSREEKGYTGKYQWDLIHNPKAELFSWLEDEEEAEHVLPCLGIFDDCDDVLKKIEAIKKAYNDGKTISGKIPETIREKILIGTHMKLGDEEFDLLKVCLYGDANKEYTINPKEYKEFWNTVTPYENDPKEKIRNGGFEFSFDGKHVLRVFAEANSLEIQEKFDALKKYLFDEEINLKEEIDIEKMHEDTKTATKIASKFTSASACNICVRSALYLIKTEPALFPTTGSGYNDPNNNYESKEIKGFITHDGGAKKIVEDFDNLSNKPELKERFLEIKKSETETWIEYFDRLQIDADKGIIIVGVMFNSDGSRGHVMMITPGGLIEIDRDEQAWGYTFFDQEINKVPRVLECGDTDRENDAPLCRNVDRKGAQQRLKWYKYTK